MTGLLISMIISGIMLFAIRVIAIWPDPQERKRRHARDRSAAARELRQLVDQARDYGLPMWVEPTRMVHGVIVHPINSTTRFDENGVPR